MKTELFKLHQHMRKAHAIDNTTNLVRHISDLVLTIDGLASDLRWRGLPVLNLLLIWPGIQSFLELPFQDLTHS